MEAKKSEFHNVDEYIALWPPEVQDKLKMMRKVIKEEAPQAEERVSWKMPTYVLHGNLVHFAAQKSHMGFYPGASGIANFTDRFTGYKYSKGAVQFPFNQPIPFDLVREIVRFRIAENTELADQKDKKKKE